ncbi:hypothetical protein LJ753_11825 [Arthrobacter sp. zg-Y20]|uniref:hypothetical protein n=1 Tax=unclassified Arthrobacter TaxID=235627 RepID=UPI001D14603E|nr:MULTISPECIES: hypothetical protein [unclassified Arthrobacter]MCC3276557.1 hypothetical protein [Arthrobacter sp. zg-Y20]MDK1316717.1 hypothetical protein [Arthrobacter sp. zg.Y20]WIB06860.1 hypothetical protein QNO06_03775 [Arthrobacter sp. zg-Y20]
MMATLSACGSASPSSVEDLSDVIEEMGYECDEPIMEDAGNESVDCGEEIYASWYPSAAKEVASFEAVSSVYEDIPSDYSVELWVIRGKQWRISGDKGAVTKVAESLDKDMDMISN